MCLQLEASAVAPQLRQHSDCKSYIVITVFVVIDVLRDIRNLFLAAHSVPTPTVVRQDTDIWCLQVLLEQHKVTADLWLIF